MEKRKKRVILIGRSMAGKTTLCQCINHEELKYYKTQTVQILNKNMIDTPGEYLERSYMRGALTVTATDADVILLVQQATEGGTMFPPGYSSTFAKPSVGIVTKSDLATEKQIQDATEYLKLAGAGKIFVTSSYENTGVEELVKYLEELEIKTE
ncbi:MAG: EutP/PduV family microcompartment system protein [Lachnospiraceae bacterium]|nr:EutP/PduV family microcompartment system protein [Lachnospiraceae bacterium]